MMDYYRISKSAEAPLKGKIVDVPGVTYRKLPSIQIGMMASLVDEFQDLEFAFSPFTHEGFAAESTWDRFNFDFYVVASGYDFYWYLVSEKLKQVLEPLKFLTEYRFYKAELLNKNTLHPKYLLVWKKYGTISEEFSQWEWGYYSGVIKPELKEVYTGVQIRDYEHFEKVSLARRELNNQYLGPKKIVVQQEFDFGGLGLMYGGGYLVSKRLKDAVEAAGITGIAFEKTYFEVEIREK
jgi:hypothetical protein